MRPASPIVLLLLFLGGACSTSPGGVGPGGDAATADTTPADAGPDTGFDLESPDLDLPPPDIAALLEEARFWLSNGEPYMALVLFEEVLDAAPDDPDAIFGAGLAQFIQAVEVLAMITNLPAQFLGYMAGDGIRDPESMNEAMADQIADVLGGLEERFARAEGHLSRITDPAFEWTIDRAPLYYVTRPLLIYRGRFDLGDVHLLRAVNGFCRWFTALLVAQDLETDFAYAIVIAEKVQGGGLGAVAILDAAAYLLAATPDFLTLHPERGPELFTEGAAHMRDIGMHILEAAAWIETEDATEQDVTRLEWDGADRILVLHNRVVLEGYEGTEEPLRIRLTDELLDATAALVDALDKPGTVVPFSAGPGLQLSTILGLAAKLGIVEQMGISLPVDISHLEIDQILVLLTGFMPDTLGFDWAGFHQNPAGVRFLLPRLADPDDPGKYLLEWECPDDIRANGFPSGTGGLLCGDAELVDGPHFVGTPWEMPADGHVSKLPYMVWDDPTIGGLVAVDVAFGTDEPPDWQVPDNALLNLGLHTWLDGLMGLF